MQVLNGMLEGEVTAVQAAGFPSPFRNPILPYGWQPTNPRVLLWWGKME